MTRAYPVLTLCLLLAALPACDFSVGVTGIGKGATFDVYGGGCYLKGIAFDEAPPGHHTPLAVGETRVLSATIGRPQGFACRLPDRFVRLEWIADITALEPRVQVRLAGCTACTVLFEDYRETAPGRQAGVKGAAVLHDSPEQKVFFQVTRIAPGRASLIIFACPEHFCIEAATDYLYF